ncbi:MAG: succinate--CoA ligase subunit alpha [Alphaproteobacteria bacterium]|nr:succinate--CoA ligase subunit alpha [Alphaproteobacteria bacterium]
MAILANKNSRVLIQGITGTQATFHVKRSLEGGTNIIAGTSPGHGGEEHLGVPVFNNVREAQRRFAFDASVLFVPAMATKNAVREAVEAEIGLIVSIASGVPVHDMLEIRSMLKGSKTLMIGPNTPGIITPGEARLGIFPDNIHKKGKIGIISRSSTLTYEAVLQTNKAELGQSTVIGLGDDMIIGTDFRELIKKFMDDDETSAVVLVGKADNMYEQLAAEYYASLTNKKPIVAFVAGEALPFGHTMGYAVDIITHGRVTVSDKKRIMREAGIIVVDRMNQVHESLLNLKL